MRGISLSGIVFDLRAMLNECEGVIQGVAEEKGVRVYFYDETALEHKLMGDPARLRRVLLTVFLNAVKLAADGHITLVAKADISPCVTEGCPLVSLTFEISDTGTGMPEGDMGMMKADIQKLGGKFSINSIPGLGKRTFLSFEFGVSDEWSEAMPTVRPVFSGCALVCEDNGIIRLAAKENIEKSGLEVFEAEDGKAAIEMVRVQEQENRPFDIIFMDIQMPTMDGFEATRKIALMGIKTPVIAMTSNFSEEDMEAYSNCGMAGYIRKPFCIRELLPLLQEHMRPAEWVSSKITAQQNRPPVLPPGGERVPVDEQLGIINCAGIEQLFCKSLDEFTDRQTIALAELKDAIAEWDLPLAVRIAHTNKNNAATIGATRLAKLSLILEESLRRDGSYFKSCLVDDYAEELSRVIEYIKGRK